MDTKPFDLNLLRVLIALDQTRHVSRAAELLGMSQSGFSTALARLRQRLGDDLFVRSADGMRPTPRALSLVDTARAALQQVEQDVREPDAFDPLKAQADFRVSMSDAAEAVMMPRLIAHLIEHAPHTAVQVSSPNAGPLHERLSQGEVDLAIGFYPDLERDTYFRQPLLDNTYACIVRRGHPVLATGLTRAAFEALGHAAVSIPARSNAMLLDTLRRERIRRRVVLSSPNHLSLAASIAQTDLVGTVPLGAAVGLARAMALEVVALPFPPPRFTIYQYWHRRTHKEPGYQWLRARLMALFNERTDPYAVERLALYGGPATPPASGTPSA